ncbi:MAG: uracil-DNA glycosylase [Desulfobacteraceae bacterium]|nr:uracil-DNA glycosylase [Desulfobacteraceae bacterium]MBC2756771.1 uracil-DNA glycosylase [Desulfobacteraceae bacterium]
MKNKKPDKHPVDAIFEGLTAHLKFLSELGCAGMECSDKSLETIQSWGAAEIKENRFSSGIYSNFIKCRDCSLLKDPKQIVCGDGNQKARLAIVGGVASPDDMQAGKPYSGKAGDLLNKILVAMNLTRDQVYITHAVKCCLPANQKPKITDVNTCRSYLDKELRLVKPDVICAFGEIAAMSLLETSVPLSRLRGYFHDYRGMRVMPTYSPEYLIQNTEAKRVVWEDLKQVIGEMEILASVNKRIDR